MKTFKPVALGISAFIYTAMTFNTALADDTEIYVPKDLPADQVVRPNILFILDSSGSMDTTVSGTTLSRNRVLKNVVQNLIDDLKTKEDVNIGLMRYRGLNNNNEQGGHVITPAKQLTNANADSLKASVEALPTSDWTPLSETYYEAYRYMAGLSPVWGATLSAPTSISGGAYISPVSHACQASHIIYITDGEPTRDQDSNTDIRTLVTGKNTVHAATSCLTGHGQCLPHLAEYMANQDLFPAPTAEQFADPTGRKQSVTSHFVGFAVNLPLLSTAATAGGGKYYKSDNTSGLTAALKAIIGDITADNTSFAAPSVAVSAFNNLGYRNDLYYALFRPSEGTRWPGNVKRYKLAKDASGNPLIVDQNGNAAIEDSTGFFSDSSSSFWSGIDGKDVAKGGVAERLLTPDTRNVLTWTSADRAPGPTDSEALAALTTDNTAVTAALLGATTATRTEYINWARGKKADNSPRLAIGDVLHNEPKLVAYTTDEDLVRVGNAQKPPAERDALIPASPEQLYMFFGDNEGFIHAINPNDGSEKFAFIPKELLKIPGDYLNDSKAADNKRYGIDGQINLWTEYSPLDARTKTRSLNKAYLYAGMRRGGSNYYALDVLNIDVPKLKWVIKGPEQTLVSANYTNATTGFTSGYSKLGRTFSAPKLAKLKVNGVETKVLIFTGGYDLDQDNVGTNVPKNDDIGNSLFVANADTGELIWHASNSGAQLNISEMTNSMPADPTLVDIDGDGLTDIAYASDLRGQVFRFDFNTANTGGDGTDAGAFATGGRFANLAGADKANNRRFFGSPDVALIRERGGKTYFTVSIGSGFRESPLNQDTNDRFYVLRDSNVFTKPASYTSIVEGDLTDVSSVDLTGPETTTILNAIATLEGQIAGLNLALNNARNNFTAYKASIGHTTKQNAASQANSDANAKQALIDTIAAGDPYLAEHTPESAQQSLLQNSLTRARDVLAGVEQARADAQALAISPGSAPDISAAAALTSLTNDLAREYQKLKTLQSDLDTAYSAITAQEAAIIAAKADSTFDSDAIPAMETALTAQRTAYAALSGNSKRTALNTGSPTEAVARLNAVNAALSAGDATAIAAALTPAMSALQSSVDLTGSATSTTAELLASNEASKSALLQTVANNNASSLALVNSLQTERNALTASAAIFQSQADALAAQAYSSSPTLTAPELSAATASVYPVPLTAFSAYQYLIDQALANASSPTTGLPKLRADINTEYAKLTPGNNYTPNVSLLAASKGFYLRLPKGEKVLSTSLSFRGSLFFSTFSPKGAVAASCGSDVGRGRTYAMSLIDASAIYVKDVAGTKTPIRSFILKRSGIPPTPSVILSDGIPTVLTGTEVNKEECREGVEACRTNDAVKATYWREN
jgi:Tfp pilus tip-associated adhesin PilY1